MISPRAHACARAAVSILAATSISIACAGDWPGFRGPNASGLAVNCSSLPAEIGPEQNVVWKVALPPGHSSPVVVGNRIFLTAERDGHLLTMGLDRATGRTLWQSEANYQKLEEIHEIGSHVQCTPASDGTFVVSFFGSSGLYCHDLQGKQLWHRPYGPFSNTFGAGNSPLIVDGRVVLYQDHDTDSFISVLDLATGQELWKTDRSEFLRNFGSPVVWQVQGKRQIVVAGTLRVAGYDFDTGKELWTVRGIARFVSATPVVGPNNVLYASGYAAGNDVGAERFQVEPFDAVIAILDSNDNGGLEEAELTDGPIKMRFVQVDRNKDGTLTREEYELFRHLFAVGRNVVVAIRPGGQGDVTQTHVEWVQTRHVPFCASPLVSRDVLFTMRDKGILTSLDARTGAKVKEARLEASGDYYASPVAGAGMVYLLDQAGRLTVVTDQAEWRVLHTAEFGENCYATPALVDNRIYLRTTGHLYCFGKEALPPAP
jgi:outer membrane protein assembly factor BamB